MRADTSIRRLLQFLFDESGQDIIEYGLLAALIGTVGVLAWTNIQSQMFSHYTGWGAGVNTLSACTPDPGGGGCP
jgi:Flp pilus assembly pilin Flp